MRTLGYKQTKELIFFVLNRESINKLRQDLHFKLKHIKSNEGQFYTGIVNHGLYMELSSEQWFILLSRLPTRILRSELPLNKILSPRQQSDLPPPIG